MWQNDACKFCSYDQIQKPEHIAEYVYNQWIHCQKDLRATYIINNKHTAAAIFWQHVEKGSF